jgi:C-terminal processing protease CtpA/Prc
MNGNIMFLKKVYFIVLSFFFISCGGNSIVDFNNTLNEHQNKESDKDCSQEEQNRVIYNRMKDSYLWYEYVPDIDYSDYNSTESLLNDLKYKEYDKWSYITTTSKYNNFYEKGIYQGFGFSIGEYNSRVLVNYVYKDSPADIAGFKRGTEILEINNKAVNREDINFWRVLLKKDVANVKTLFKISNNHIEEVVSIKKEIIDISPIFTKKIIYKEDKKIGYFLFNRFIEPTRLELKTLFDKFKKEEIDELIVDMRYNGGGRVSIANYLASLISGESTDKMLFEKLEYNNKNENLNTTLNFLKERNSLDLERVFIISTEETCSASESLINGLEPYLTVNLIGSKTCGKPVGMRGVDFCGKHLSPVEFTTVNAEGKSNYFSGIAPRCRVADDIFHKLGDIEESMLKETLFFIKYNVCYSVNKRYKKEKKIIKTSPLLRGFQKEIGTML